MNIMLITETMHDLEGLGDRLTEEDKCFIVQFAFRTGDKGLVKRLTEELSSPGVDREKVAKKFMGIAEKKPRWIERVEDLLVAIEMYRVQEERALTHLARILENSGIPISENDMKTLDIDTIRKRIIEEI